MSDDTKDNVIEGIFPRADEVEEVEEDRSYADGSEMLEILSEYCLGVDATVVSLVYVPGSPMMLAANVDLESINGMLDMGKFELMHRILDQAESYEEEPDGTIH